ncbi:MAG: acyl-CoA dehydrogenase family protein [Actinomycetota bacterium]|jgi:3-hydroxy-9,10-secoandrosta-1,3,5(10)-triene-9,17-dione monooxygenase|nr:acyl-CoA dehydrogenase family protein [Actinomycetota bacterium]
MDVTTDREASAWAESMVPALAARAQETEELREVPQATIDEVTAAGAWGLVMPTEAGGWGLGLRALTDVTRIMAHGCVSSSWTISFLMLHNWFLLRSPQELQDAVLTGRNYALIPCPLAPTGTATPVDGGYEVSGRWQWATGVQHADWVMVNTMVDRDGTPESRFCLAPIGDVEVDDVWHTSGMRGTGSNDVVAEDLFVPEHLSIAAVEFRGDDNPGARLRPDNPFVAYPLTPVLTLIAASPALGGAEAAVDHFRDYLKDRVLPYSAGVKQADQGAAQVRLAEARATVRAARLVWQDTIDQLCDAYDHGRVIEPADRGRFRLATAQVVKLSRQAVNIALEGAGASMYFLDSPMQRTQRDLETIKGHVVYDWDRAAQLAGKLELGFEPGPLDML